MGGDLGVAQRVFSLKKNWTDFSLYNLQLKRIYTAFVCSIDDVHTYYLIKRYFTYVFENWSCKKQLAEVLPYLKNKNPHTV